MTFDVALMFQYLPELLTGLVVTVQICVVALAGALALGLAISLMRTSPSMVLRAIATVYVDVIRNVPFMVQVFLMFYVLPFFEIRLSPVTIGILALLIFATAYYGEVFRGAINSVPRGHYESGLAIGFGHVETMCRIVLPQSVRFVIPPLTNNTISLVKESAILSTITVPEMTQAAQRITGITFSPFEVYLMVALIYWGLALCIANGARAIGGWAVAGQASHEAAVR